MIFSEEIHIGFLEAGERRRAVEITDRMASRRQKLRVLIAEQDQETVDASEHEWLCRSYPVLSILAPAVTTHENKIEFPGDPICLYSALSVAVSEAVKAKELGLEQVNSPYNDLCPRWGSLPSKDYRLAASDEGIRPYVDPLVNLDQTVFDPRVWNSEIEQYLESLLVQFSPKVILVSMVSPAHRYAIAIARVVRKVLPHSLIVFGGRHIDETLHYIDKEKRLELKHSSTFSAMSDGRIEKVVDFLVRGDGYYALDFLMKCISLAMDIERKEAKVERVIEVMECRSRRVPPLPGRALIAALDGDVIHGFPIRGELIDLSVLPSPYAAFAIRARFPIFCSGDGTPQRTAHLNSANACPFKCSFCSESVEVVGYLSKRPRNGTEWLLDRVLEYVKYGAQALFFDDSLMLSGRILDIISFCSRLSALKAQARQDGDLANSQVLGSGEVDRLISLQWGCQLSIGLLETFHKSRKARKLLRALKAADCTYIYIGIESMSSDIMDHIHKAARRRGGRPWALRAREILSMIREEGIRVGASVLFGLEGETRATIYETITTVADLIRDDLLYIVSPNVCTYHPGTELSKQHGVEDELDYVSLNWPTKEPYTFFEEAFPGLVTKELSEADIWYIYRKIIQEWQPALNSNFMRPSMIPD